MREAQPHKELVTRVLDPDTRRRFESFVDGPTTQRWLADQAFVLAERVRSLEEQHEALQRELTEALAAGEAAGEFMTEQHRRTIEQVETLRELNDRVISERDEGHAGNERLNEQLEALVGPLEQIARLHPADAGVAPVIARRTLERAGLNPAKQPYVYSGDVNDPGPFPASRQDG